MGRRGGRSRRVQAPGRGGDVHALRTLHLRGRVRFAPRPLEAAAGMKTETHMTIDRIKCDGHGLCPELLPELIRLDDWGYPIISHGPISKRLAPLAQRAIATSPVLPLARHREPRQRRAQSSRGSSTPAPW